MAIVFGSVLAVTAAITHSAVPYIDRKVYEGAVALVVVAAKTGIRFIRRK
jgi:hypothetical protein